MYATFNGDSKASDTLTNREHADHVCARQNAKAEAMGIKARYAVKDAEPTVSDKGRDTIPSVWQ